MITKKLTAILLTGIITFSCGNVQQKHDPLNISLQEKKSGVIDGTIDAGEWSAGEKITAFISPWKKCKVPETVFYISADNEFLYFAFKVTDENIAAISSDDENNVAAGDRVEVFFAGDKELKEYYCIEIGPYGDILDYKASFYRIFDNEWDTPGLQVKTSASEKGYEVEGRIPLSFLYNMKDIKAVAGKKCFYMGVYRADFSEYRKDDESVLWLTWINPMVKKADFHIFSSFSKVCIEYP